ncbi:DUF2249 domain-containing protein [Myxococcota bacterium]|nr:DUF2249 domain-containing protein [Myxococcota bacterium]
MIWISEARAVHGIADVQTLLDRVGDGGVLELVGFAPGPELSVELLRARGIFVDDAEPGVLRLGRSPVPPLVDLRFREPPEPLHETLLAAEQLAPGERWCGRYPHYPAPLVPILRARGVEHAVTTRPDGTGLVWMRRR